MSAFKVPAKRSMPKPCSTSTPIVSSSTLTANSSVQSTRPRSKQEREALKKDVKDCLKVLAAGNIHLINLNAVSQDFLSNTHLGDHLQYELHNYCKMNTGNGNISSVIKLAELCYSNESVSHFSNMDRFVGCVFHISAYLIKRKKYTAALSVVYSLFIKKEEILETSKESLHVQNFLYNLHSTFISTAITMASKLENELDKNQDLVHKLAMASVGFLQYTNILEKIIVKKVLKSSKLYLHTLQYYSDQMVSEFYKTLMGVLVLLIPNFNETDYMCYFLCKMDHMKNLNLTKPLDIRNRFKNILNKILVMSRDSLKVKSSFERILDFFFIASESQLSFDEYAFNDIQKVDVAVYKYVAEPDKNKKLLKKLNVAGRTLKIEPINKVYFLLLSSIFHYGLLYWWEEYDRDWRRKVSVLFIKKLFSKILTFYKFHCRPDNLCCSSTSSPLEICFSDLLTGNIQKIMYTIRICFKNNIYSSVDLGVLSQEAFRISIECLDAMKEKECCHNLRNCAWKHSVIHLTNTIEDILRVSGTNESWRLLRTCSEDVLSAIVSLDFELPYDYRRINILFQRWHFANLKTEQFNESCYVAILYYVCFPQDENEIMSIMLQAKKESDNEIFQGILLSEQIQSSYAAIKEFKKNVLISEIDMKALHLMELKAYGSCPLDTFKNPATAFDLVRRIWKHLSNYSLDIWEKASALCFVVITAVHANEERLCPTIENECSKIIEKLLKETENKNKCRSWMFAGNLAFFIFLYHVKKVENSDGNMNSSQMVLGYLKRKEEEKVKFGEEIDMNLTCNVIPTSSHLSVDLETNYLTALDEVVSTWSKALECDMEKPPSRFEYDMWLQNIKQVAHLFELYGEHRKSLTTWLLFYKVGKLSDDSAAVLLGLSHLIESVVDIDKCLFFEEAEATSEKFILENKEKNILVEYWTTVASNYLKNKKPKKCENYLTKAYKTLEVLKSSIKYFTLSAKFWCLVSQFLCVYPDYETEYGFALKTDFRVMVFKAFSYANAGAKNEYLSLATQGECAEIVLVMLEVNLWAYYFFGIYSKTDFMRFFLNDLYQIVQKLFLPTRIAEILVRLAEVDMLCEKTTECQEKVTTLKSILTTLTSKCEKRKSLKARFLFPSEPEKVVEKLSPRAVSPARFLDDISSRDAGPSPIHLHLNDVKPSKEHADICKCRPCRNLLIQVLTMEVLALEGQMSLFDNSYKRGDPSFIKALDIMNKVEDIRSEQTKTLRQELQTSLKSDPGELDFQMRMVRFQSARLSIKYGFYESSKMVAAVEELRKVLESVSKLMYMFTYEEVLLRWTFTELKVAVFLLNRQSDDDNKPKKKTVIEYKTPGFAKTPVPGFKSKENFATIKANRRMVTKPDPVEEDKENISKSESELDLKNTAFIGENNLPNDDKPHISPKKLSFSTGEPTAIVTTVKKAVKDSNIYLKPRKLNLDESSDNSIDLKKKFTATKTSGVNTRTSTVIAAAEKPIKKAEVPSVKVHVDGAQSNRKRVTKVLWSANKNTVEEKKKTVTTTTTARSCRVKK